MKDISKLKCAECNSGSLIKKGNKYFCRSCKEFVKVYEPKNESRAADPDEYIKHSYNEGLLNKIGLLLGEAVGLQHPGNHGVNMLHGDHNHKPLYGKNDSNWSCPKCGVTNTLKGRAKSGAIQDVTCKKCGHKAKVHTI